MARYLSSRRTLSLLVIGVLLALVAAPGCGKQQTSVGAERSGMPTQGQGALGTSGVTDTGTAGLQGPISAPTGSPGTGGRATTGASAPPGAAAKAVPGDTTGITDTEIRIGLHAPLTGASPVGNADWEKVANLYWKKVNDEQGGVFGRKVKIVIADDKYTPDGAVAACRKLAEESKVMSMFGLAGVDQIAACAKWATSRSIPYISSGASEQGMKGLKYYFAATMTYPAQAKLLADFVMKRLDGAKKKIAQVQSDTPNNDDQHDAFVAAMRKYGKTLVVDDRVDKAGSSDAQYATEVQKLRAAGAQIVFVHISPTNMIKLARMAESQGYKPQWVGTAPTWSMNLAIQGAGTAMDGALTFSSWVSIDSETPEVREYKDTWTKYYGQPSVSEQLTMDLGMFGWGLNKSTHEVLRRAGRDLSREKFMAAMETVRDYQTGIIAPVSYLPGNHLAIRHVTVFKGDAVKMRWVQTEGFVDRF